MALTFFSLWSRAAWSDLLTCWVVTCCHWRRICPYKLHKLHKCLWIKKNKCLGSQNGLPKRFCMFLFASSDLRLQEDRPCMCQLFRCCCVSWLETKPDVADQKGGTEGGKSWQITFPTIFQRCHQKPLMNDLKYFKESQKYKFSISHTSLLIPIWPGYPSLLATFRWEGLWNDRFSRAPRHCVQTKIDWKFSIRSLGDP